MVYSSHDSPKPLALSYSFLKKEAIVHNQKLFELEIPPRNDRFYVRDKFIIARDPESEVKIWLLDKQFIRNFYPVIEEAYGGGLIRGLHIFGATGYSEIKQLVGGPKNGHLTLYEVYMFMKLIGVNGYYRPPDETMFTALVFDQTGTLHRLALVYGEGSWCIVESNSPAELENRRSLIAITSD